MILWDNGEVMSESEEDYVDISKLEKASDAESWNMPLESSWSRREHSMLKSRQMTWSGKEKTFSIHNATSMIRYLP